MIILTSTWTVLKDLMKKKWLLENIFTALQRMKKLVMMVKYQMVIKDDVLLSADVFQKFNATCLKFYGLDPCHYFRFPGLSWDAMLKMTGVKLDKT